MSSFTHLILTRFNVRVDAAWSRAGLDPAWLEHRFGLFDRYCLPSIEAQTERAFTWLIFFDAATPEPFRARAEALAGRGFIRPVFLDRFDPAPVSEAVRAALTPGAARLVTTRLDNDDALSVDHVARVRDHVADQAFAFVNFDRGFVLRDGRLYEHRHPSNAFASLIEALEPGSAPRTVWSVQHMQIAGAGPVIHDQGPPAWLQIVHGRNVSNRVRGRRRRREALREGFPFAARGDGGRDSALGVLADRALFEPARASRDAAIALGRRLRRGLSR
ncbi:MAG: hypothetical protein D6693_04385 [Planctomycetota bacterium]|nr:MAG: hypothetical protein D6693_04385 [Planctomycetota bacterium]